MHPAKAPIISAFGGHIPVVGYGTMLFPEPERAVGSTCWRGYNIKDTSDFKHRRINHSKHFFDFIRLGENNVF
jgi:hypothetical protein